MEKTTSSAFESIWQLGVPVCLLGNMFTAWFSKAFSFWSAQTKNLSCVKSLYDLYNTQCIPTEKSDTKFCILNHNSSLIHLSDLSLLCWSMCFLFFVLQLPSPLLVFVSLPWHSLVSFVILCCSLQFFGCSMLGLPVPLANNGFPGCWLFPPCFW